MITVNTHEAKTGFSSLLKKVEEDNETIIVCRNGHPIAEIHAVSKATAIALPAVDKKLAVKLMYDPTEPLDAEDLPDDCR
jgi:antitoxin (DNA-binding transcriptional repressor) of toxin-antitoxin stability system